MKRWFVPLIVFILVHLTCTVVNHNICIYSNYIYIYTEYELPETKGVELTKLTGNLSFFEILDSQ